MKKFIIFLAILLLVFMTGLAQAQLFVDPDAGPEIWVTSVFNNSSSTISKGSIVIWDIDESTGDNDNYINTTTVVDTSQAAGIVWPVDILSKEIGSIVVRGTGITVIVTTNTTGVQEGTQLCTSGTAGTAGHCSEIADPNNIGFCTSDNSGGTCVAYISAL